MGLASTVRAALAGAKTAIGDLAATVTHEPYSHQNADAEDQYGASVSREGVIALETKAINLGDRVVLSTARITFVEPVAVNLRDRFTLPDGTTAPCIAVRGVVDSGNASGLMFATTVILGEGRSA